MSDTPKTDAVADDSWSGVVALVPYEFTQQQERRIAELEKALRGMEAMYTHVWDRVDGSLVCMPESVDRFEAAHREARKALGL